MIKRTWRIYAEPSQLQQKLGLSHWLFLIFWLLKPFYIFASGTVQPSDAIFLLAFVVWLIERRGEVSLGGGNQYFLYFFLSVFAVNSVYTVVYRDVVFLEKTLYYLYSLLVVIAFPALAENRRFLRLLFSATAFNIIVQMFLFVFNLGGRLYGGIRYMGSFNDPNQFSFFLFASFLLLFLLTHYLYPQAGFSKHAGLYMFFGMIVFLIFQGSSTGAFLGVMAFVAALMLSFVTFDRAPMRMIVKIVFFGLMFIAFVLVIGLIVAPELFDIQMIGKSFMLQRVFQKLGKVSSGGLMAIADERQFSRVFLYPINLIYGAGEGLYGRFVQTEPLEIHSTIIALWFYYGMVPMAFLAAWIKNKLSGLPLAVYPVFLGLFFESLILANQRQPILWMLLLIGDLLSRQHHAEKRYGFLRKI